MSWREGRRPATLAPLLALGAAVALAGCGIRPLYAPTAAGTTASAALAAVSIAPLDTRVGQVLRNELIFGFTGGGPAATPAYGLRLVLTSQESELVIEQIENIPEANLVALTVTYTLTELATGDVLLTGATFANASFDYSTQRFANIRAERDAEDRAARRLASNILSRVATYFATHPAP